MHGGLIFSEFHRQIVGKSKNCELHRSADSHIAKAETFDTTMQCHEGAAVLNALVDASIQFGDTIKMIYSLFLQIE